MNGPAWPVQRGRESPYQIDAVELVSGAQPADQIVVSGADAFGDAVRVQIAD